MASSPRLSSTHFAAPRLSPDHETRLRQQHLPPTRQETEKDRTITPSSWRRSRPATARLARVEASKRPSTAQHRVRKRRQTPSSLPPPPPPASLFSSQLCRLPALRRTGDRRRQRRRGEGAVRGSEKTGQSVGGDGGRLADAHYGWACAADLAAPGPPTTALAKPPFAGRWPASGCSSGPGLATPPAAGPPRR